MKTKEIILPEGFEIDKVENGKIILKEISKPLPKTWEEWVKQNPNNTEWYVTNEKYIKGIQDPYIPMNLIKIGDNLFPTKEYAIAYIALIKLIRLRDTYRQGWKPNWEDDSVKYTIIFKGNGLELNETYFCRLFTFQSSKVRDEFYENFKDLLEKILILFI